jgi:hypothetical protein
MAKIYKEATAINIDREACHRQSHITPNTIDPTNIRSNPHRMRSNKNRSIPQSGGYANELTPIAYHRKSLIDYQYLSATGVVQSSIDNPAICPKSSEFLVSKIDRLTIVIAAIFKSIVPNLG